MLKFVQIYFDFLDSIEPLDDAERGRLFTAILQYASTGELPELTGNERFVFPTAKGQIDRDREKYDRVCSARSEYGKKGAIAKASKSKHKLAKGGKSSQNKDKDKDKEENKDKYITPTEYEPETALDIALSEFKQYRKETKHPLNELAEKKLLKELDRLAEGDDAKKIMILDQSIRNGWRGVFDLPPEKNVVRQTYAQHPATNLDHLLVNLDD